MRLKSLRRALGLAAAAAVSAALVAPVPGASADPGEFGDAATRALPSSPQTATALTTADVDLDGVADVLVTGADTGSGATPSGVLSVLPGGDGTAARVDSPAGSRAFGVAAGDLDGDGVPDAVTTTFDGVNVLRGNGNGTFAAPVRHTAGNLRQPVLADVDGDGRLDIAAANNYHGSFLGAVDVLRNVGDGSFTLTRVDLGRDTFPTRLAAGDLDLDGDVDLVASGSGDFHVLLGVGGGGFAPPVRYAWSYTNSFGQTGFRATITDTAIGDVDGDGWPDVVAASSNDSAAGVWFFPGAGGGGLDFTRAVSRRAGQGAETLTTTDVDADGRLDVVVATAGGAYAPAVLNRRTGADPWPTVGYQGSGPHVRSPFPGHVAAGDVDGDGWTDLLTLAVFDRQLLTRTQVAPAAPPGTPPRVVVDSPQAGAAYEQGLSAAAYYDCFDDDGFVATCSGSVGWGEPFDTSTPGPAVFEVTATDGDGATTVERVEYEVLPAAPPSVVVTVPQDGASYAQGDWVFADYVCDDGLGAGVAACNGTVPVGWEVDTATVGTHTFTVDAVDLAGNATTVSVTYEVVPAGSADVDPPVVRIASPVDGATYTQGQSVTAVYECEDFGSGLTSCRGPVPDGALVPTSTAGGRSFTVTATDAAGNATSRTVSYYVEASPPPADTTAPYVLVRTPKHNARYATGSSHLVDYSCFDWGTGATGVATCTGSVPSGSPLDTATPGQKSITIVTTDQAGNTRSQTVTYEVIDDRDGDGLSDQWETQGVDIDRDGVVDLPLHRAPYGANPDRRDLFVEMDYMTCEATATGCSPGDLPSHAPEAGVQEDLVQAFADAPVRNPDGSTGITLHYLVDEAVPEIEMISWYRAPGTYDDVEDVKAGPAGDCNGAFGTAADRSSPDCVKLLRAKNQVYRWGLFGHLYDENPGSSGIAEYPGNDFLVTVGGAADAWISAVGSLRVAEAATVMHELGHTVGLGHGGPKDDLNCKPNYLSVMNYSLTMPYHDPTAPLDYSRAALAGLDESRLDEDAGIGGPTGRNTVHSVDGQVRVVPADGPIDWNGDSLFGVVAADVNTTWQCEGGPGEMLGGADDWSNLQYSFVAATDFASGSRASSDVLIEDEVTAEDALTAAQTTDGDGDGFSNAEDVCPAVADPGQADLDGDGIGDACDPATTVGVAVVPLASVPGSQRFLQVAVLATDRLRAVDVDPASLRFGRTGTEAAGVRCTNRDVDRDRLPDLVCQYEVRRSGLVTGTNSATLTGRTTSGVAVTGSTTVELLP